MQANTHSAATASCCPVLQQSTTQVATTPSASSFILNKAIICPVQYTTPVTDYGCQPVYTDATEPLTGAGVEPPQGPDVLGHRHDQTALSVIAWRLGVQLTNCPRWFSYAGGETEETCLIAKGI